MKEKLKIKNINIAQIIIYIIFLFIYFFALFVHIRFEDISFEQLLYNVTNVEGANFSIVLTGAIFIITRIVITFLIVYLVYFIYNFFKIKLFFYLEIKNKVLKIDIFKKSNVKTIIFLILFIFLTLYGACKLLNIDEYIKNQIHSSKVFEEYYVDGRKVNLEFPKEKRNLIYIYAESLEMSNASNKNGGMQEKSYIPNLEKLALNNINFSNTDKLGGGLQLNNTSWTMAALVAQTSGVPLKLSLNNSSYTDYSEYLPGVYNLGDILKENGYNNYFMIGSDANFGGRKDYFENHGDYTIYDYVYAQEEKLIEPDYHVWWGYEDNKLFEFAKDKILEASIKDKPFNFTLLTVDTHFTDGYMDSTCEEVFDDKYANSIYCSDSKIYSFVKWIMKQEFYENTTIIISGDHLTMQYNFYEKNDDYTRTIYNTFINSAIPPTNEKNRLFSSFDMFPTTLAALGVEIEDNKLGLGVNLFSEEETLIETLGLDYFNNEIAKKSIYYDTVLLSNK